MELGDRRRVRAHPARPRRGAGCARGPEVAAAHEDVLTRGVVVGPEPTERVTGLGQVDLDGLGEVPAAGVDVAAELAVLHHTMSRRVELDRVIPRQVADFQVPDHDVGGVPDADAHRRCGQPRGGAAHVPQAALDDDPAVTGVAAEVLPRVPVDDHCSSDVPPELRPGHQREAGVGVDPQGLPDQIHPGRHRHLRAAHVTSRVEGVLNAGGRVRGAAAVGPVVRDHQKRPLVH